jgi:Fanconi-associated nuclease 1
VGNNGEEVTVEMFALQEYESHGYKGYVHDSSPNSFLKPNDRFHCEGRILTTLFGLLLWDILFANVPGTLETPWQSAPMDIAEDSFYFSRKELINERLAEIESGKATTILAKFDDLHRGNNTWCVGVRWDLFTKQDLTELVDVSDTTLHPTYFLTVRSVHWRQAVVYHLPSSRRGLRQSNKRCT